MAKGFIGVILLIQLTFVACVPPTSCQGETPYEPIVDTDPKVDNLYYICFDTIGKPITKDCPDQYKYNKDTKSCTLPTSSGAPNPTLCTKEGQLFDDPTNNIGEVCNNLNECKDDTKAGYKFLTGSCSTGELFNIFESKCVPENEWYCGEKGPDCDVATNQNKRFLDKFDCTSYYQCYDDVRVKGKCPAGMIFDGSDQRCVDKGSSTCKKLNLDNDESIEGICKGHAGDFVVDNNYCMGYYYCVDEKTPYWSVCANDKYFNNGKCTSTRPPTCKCEGINWQTSPSKVLMKHPDKSKFYVCEKGKRAAERSCPGGTVYNGDVESCVAG